MNHEIPMMWHEVATLDNVNRWRDNILEPLDVLHEHTDQWHELRIKLMDFIDSVELMSCTDMSQGEIQDIHILGNEVADWIDRDYQSIMSYYDEVIEDQRIESMRCEN